MTSGELPHATKNAARAAGALGVVGVLKSFGGVQAVDDVSVQIAPGEFFALLGPSGCGKTTLLRMIAGFEFPDHGRILLDGKDITAMPPHRRPVNMMFQNYALFPHLSVAENIAFGLRSAGLGRAAREARVGEMLSLVRLEPQRDRKPDQLSGGQRQRVALARALACAPRLLLLDEPLTALDRKLREATRAELLALQKRTGVTFVMVTHDQDEAMMMAGRIGLMNAGRLVQVGAPHEIYERPASRWAAQFVGEATFLDGALRRNAAGVMRLHVPDLGDFDLPRTTARPEGAAACLALRPERVALLPPGEAGGMLQGIVAERGYSGNLTAWTVRLPNGAQVKAARANALAGAPAFAPGDTVALAWRPDAAILLDES